MPPPCPGLKVQSVLGLQARSPPTLLGLSCLRMGQPGLEPAWLVREEHRLSLPPSCLFSAFPTFPLSTWHTGPLPSVGEGEGGSQGSHSTGIAEYVRLSLHPWAGGQACGAGGSRELILSLAVSKHGSQLQSGQSIMVTFATMTRFLELSSRGWGAGETLQQRPYPWR